MFLAINCVIEVCTKFVYINEDYPRGLLHEVRRGDFLNVCGKATLALLINHLSMCHEFVVVENITLNDLIGYDFMHKFNVVINFVNRSAFSSLADITLQTLQKPYEKFTIT